MIFNIAKGLARRNHNAVPGMNAHGIEVFHVADRDAIAFAISHHLVLHFLPAQQAALHHQLAPHAELESLAAGFPELLAITRNAASRSPQGVSRPNDAGVRHNVQNRFKLGITFDNPAFGNWLFDLVHQRAEQLPVFGLLDRFQLGSQQLHVVLFKNPGAGELRGQVESGLAAQGRNESVGAFARDDAL